MGDGYTEDVEQFPLLRPEEFRDPEEDVPVRIEDPGKMETLLEYDPLEDQLLVQIESPTSTRTVTTRGLQGEKGLPN